MALSSSRAGLSMSTRAGLRAGAAPATTTTTRSFSQSLARRQDHTTTPADSASFLERFASEQPLGQRWARTPERMKASIPLGMLKNPDREVWKVNQDPARLSAFYRNFLGRGGDRMLPEELKWQAVTHKSFDQGRRPFNHRLANFGRRILSLEATQTIMALPPPAKIEPAVPEPRQPFEHPALARIDMLGHLRVRDVLSPEKMSRLAMEFGAHEVVRWKPRAHADLAGSGLPLILTDTICAIIGAVAMQHGGEIARRVCRERVLRHIKSEAAI